MAIKCNMRIVFKLITIFVTILLLLFIFYGVRLGILQDKTVLVEYMKRLGIWGPLFFILFQAVQVVFPVIPGGASCFAGVLAFGSIFGFLYNYLGLILGSFLAFSLSRKYGLNLVQKLFPKETIDKYLKYIQNHTFAKIFFWGIFLPGLPDDLLCYIAGLSKMDYKMFLWIILIGKPLSLFMYSFFMELF